MIPVFAPTLFMPTAAAAGGLLLDTLAATAKPAYSTRKLRTAYAGSALQIKRSNDSASQNIGFDGSNNLDTTALSSFVGANTGTINIWYDQSTGAALNATPPTGTGPILVNAGTLVTLNSQACPSWASANQNCLGWDGTTIAQPDTYAMVAIHSSFMANHHTLDGLAGSRQLFTGAGGTWGLYAGGGSGTYTGASDTNLHGFIIIFDDAHSGTAIYVDNSLSGSGNGGTQNPGNPQGIGVANGGATIDGKIAEHIVFTSNISSGDRALLKSSWTAYWGTP